MTRTVEALRDQARQVFAIDAPKPVLFLLGDVDHSLVIGLVPPIALGAEQHVLAGQALELGWKRILGQTLYTHLAHRLLVARFVDLLLFQRTELVLVVLALADELDLLFEGLRDDDYLTAVRTLDSVFILEPVHQAFLYPGYFDQVLVAGDAELVLHATLQGNELPLGSEAVRALAFRVLLVEQVELHGSDAGPTHG